MLKITLVAALLAVSSISVPAFAKPLTASEIKQKISGKRVLLQTPYGLEFPLIYKRNGRVKGDGTGFGFSRLFEPKETGRWWVQGNRMCQQFPTWYNGKAFCFTLQDGGTNKLIWRRNDGLEGTARIA